MSRTVTAGCRVCPLRFESASAMPLTGAVNIAAGRAESVAEVARLAALAGPRRT
jgi:hypothetical protein